MPVTFPAPIHVPGREFDSADGYVHLWPETTWGVPNRAAGFLVPFTDYSVQDTPEAAAENIQVGSRFQHHQSIRRHNVSGSLGLPLTGYVPGDPATANPATDATVAQQLLTWAFDLEAALSGPSYGSQYVSGADPAAGLDVEHAGMRVNTATLTGQSGGVITLQTDLIGRTETVMAGADQIALPADEFLLPEMLFCDCTLTETTGGASNDIPIGSFNLQLSNNLSAEFRNNCVVTRLTRHQPRATFSFTFDKTDNALDAAARLLGAVETSYELSVSVQAWPDPSPSHTYTATFAIPRAALIPSPKNKTPGQIAQSEPQFALLSSGTPFTLTHAVT